jgi:hypothetical protein
LSLSFRAIRTSPSLYLLIDYEDMPPSKSDVTRLNEAEKAPLVEWIRSGAVVGPDPVLEPVDNTDRTQRR